jgi:hypothetical protein
MPQLTTHMHTQRTDNFAKQVQASVKPEAGISSVHTLPASCKLQQEQRRQRWSPWYTSSHACIAPHNGSSSRARSRRTQPLAMAVGVGRWHATTL